MALPNVLVSIQEQKGGLMHILMLMITIAFVVCVLLLAAFGLFMISPLARHADRFHEPGQRQDSPRLD